MKCNINKRYVFLCVILCCALFLLSCGTGSKKINAPVDIRYIVQNSLVFSEVTENNEFDGMTYIGSYFQISGLKDQQVEEKVNERLKGIYAKYCPGEIPQEAREKYGDLECVKQEITLICSGNFNNIFSIIANYNWEYEDEEKDLSWQGIPYEPIQYMKTETYNIDLNMGEEFSLKEVFADNVDYAAMIKSQAEDILKIWEVEVQKDVLDKVIENYLEEPQFVLSNSTFQTRGIQYPDSSSLGGQEREMVIDLHFDENFAVTERFYDPQKNIYTSDKEGDKTLLTHVSEEEGWEKNYTEEGIDISLRGSYQKGFPEQIRQVIKAEAATDDKRVEEVKQVLKGVAKQETGAAYSKTVTTSKVQDFINIRIYEDAYVYSEKTDISYLSHSHQTLRCYREGSDEPASIRDIFAEGVDAEKILETLVLSKLEANQRLLEESGYQRSMDVTASAKGAADKFLGFCVNYESIFAEYQGDAALPSYIIELKYADIGYENLNIFE